MLYIAVGFLAIRFFVSVANLLARPYLQVAELEDLPLVSVLIPARNEAANIHATLQSLVDMHYPNLEVIVLDDGSEDETYAIAAEFARVDARFRVEKGSSLPEDWLGKNWACHQLAGLATGDWLLFIDADVVLHSGAIQGGLVEMQKRDLALLSLFPDQIMVTTGEKLVVPVMHHLLLSLLPLPLVTASKNPAFAAANGQYMLFNATTYRVQNWHEQVKDEIVEDIAIMRRVKAAGLKGRVLLGNRLVQCRMYHNFQEGWRGFSKNLLAGFNNSIIGLLFYLLLVSFAWIAFVVEPQPVLLALFVGLSLGIRVCISLLGKQPVWFNLFFHPVQQVIWTGMSLRSAWLKIRGNNEWKGRNINLKKTKKATGELASQEA